MMMTTRSVLVKIPANLTVGLFATSKPFPVLYLVEQYDTPMKMEIKIKQLPRSRMV